MPSIATSSVSNRSRSARAGCATAAPPASFTSSCHRAERPTRFDCSAEVTESVREDSSGARAVSEPLHDTAPALGRLGSVRGVPRNALAPDDERASPLGCPRHLLGRGRRAERGQTDECSFARGVAVAVSVATADKIRERKLAAQAAYHTRSGTSVRTLCTFKRSAKPACLGDSSALTCAETATLPSGATRPRGVGATKTSPHPRSGQAPRSSPATRCEASSRRRSRNPGGGNA